MATVDDVLTSPALRGLRRISRNGGERGVATVWLAEQFSDVNQAPADSLVFLGRVASATATDYRLDMAVRWAAIRGVAAVAAFSEGPWRPPITALDIAERAGIALVSAPENAELTGLIRTILREIGGDAERALSRADFGLNAVLEAEAQGADLERLRLTISNALGVAVELNLSDIAHPGTGPAVSPAEPDDAQGRPAGAAGGVKVPIRVAERVVGDLTAPDVSGELAVAVRLVLHAAASVAGHLLDLARRARELPIRSRSELLAELLMSEAALTEDLMERAVQLGVPITGWHVAVRIEAENLDEAAADEVQRFELLETAGQAALLGASSTGGRWYLSKLARTVILVRMTTSHPGALLDQRAAASAQRALAAIQARLPGLRLRAGVGTAHEGPMGLRASVAEARIALAEARAAGRAEAVASHDAAGVKRMLMEWYASDTARASVRAQLAPIEQLGRPRAETAIRTLATYLDQQGSVVRTAEALHLHRNAVTYRLRRITDLLGVDLGDPDQRLALQLACRARLLAR
jgi:DNA-binding PucR family transcriptional regulator